jgi:predicted nuclease of predicted toxin-antitoxin system
VKLLLDENLSPRLVELLSDVYPGSEHVEALGLGGAGDSKVWWHAKEHGFTIVSKDSELRGYQCAGRCVAEGDLGASGELYDADRGVPAPQ